MKKIVVVLMLLPLICGSLFANGTAEDKPMELIVYASVDEANTQKILDAFTASTGIKASSVHLSSGPALARLEAEKGAPQADIWLGAPSDNHVTAKEKGLTVPYKSAAYDALKPEFKDADGYWRAFYMNPLCFGVNTEALKKAGLPMPKSWADLADPIYKGTIQAATPQASGTAKIQVYSLVEMMGEDEAFKYLAKLGKNIQTYTSSGTGPSKGVNVGDCIIGIQFSPAFFKMQAEGAPVEVVFPSEGFGFEFPAVSMLKGAKNVEAAKIFMDWLVSAEGQNVFNDAGTYFYPVIADAKIASNMPAFDTLNVVGIDLTYYSQNHDRLIERWVNEVLTAK